MAPVTLRKCHHSYPKFAGAIALHVLLSYTRPCTAGAQDSVTPCHGLCATRARVLGPSGSHVRDCYCVLK
jgi:hypothetical protein